MKPPNVSWLTVDPGLQGTGWAHWQKTRLMDCGILHPKGLGPRASVVDRSRELARQVASLALQRYAVCVACEWPAFHGGSVGGEMVARRGDLVKLCYLVGVISGMLCCPFIPVEVQAWKGNLPKDVVEHRVREVLGEGTMEALNIRSHSVDAVGIGLYLIGELK